MMKFEENLIRKIESEESETFRILKDVTDRQRDENRRIREAKKFEREKFEEFKKIIEGKKYFRIAHIDSLNLSYDICIHLSSKGAGKTTELFRIMTNVINRGEKFMYGRVYSHELERELIEFNSRDDSPVYALKYNSNGYFFRRDEVMDWMKTKDDGEIVCTPTFKMLRNFGLNFVGKGYTFTASNCLSGGRYENYTTIFFDEILSYSTVNRINKKVLDAGDASLHTIQRNKKSLKVYLFGNLQDVPDHPLLMHYGIDIDDNLRYIRRGEDEKCCKILYINSGGLYENTIGHKGGAAMHTSIERGTFLKYNRVIKPTTFILNSEIFDKMDHAGSFSLRVRNVPYYVELKELKNEGGEILYNAIKCAELKLTTILTGKIYTPDPYIYNKFMNTTSSYSIDGIFNTVHRLFKSKSLYFDSLSSFENYTELNEYNVEYLYENQPQPSILCL